jgi:hypothetical protein
MNRSVDRQKPIQCNVLKDVALGGFRRHPGQKFSSDVKAKPNELTS